MKIQTKTTLLFTAFTALVLIVLAFTIYYFSNQYTYADFYKRLELRARISAKFRFEQNHVSTEAFRQIQKQYLERLQDEESYFIPINADGSFKLPYPPGVPESYLRQIAQANGTTVFYRLRIRHYAGLLYKDDTGHFLVIESALNSYGSEIMSRLQLILLITLVIAISIVYFAGRYFSRQTFSPFRNMNNRVQAISEMNLHLRLQEESGSDEIASLIRTFNKMLDRLETAFETQNNFISNASHELRTPLTAIVAEADYAISRDRSSEQYRESLSAILFEAGKLEQLTAGLLALAQTSFDGEKLRWEKLRIDQVLFEIKMQVDSLVPGNKVMLDMAGIPEEEDSLSFYGNADLIKTALCNLVLNACKYSSNGPVAVSLSVHHHRILIAISDNGIGIPAADLKHIYDPFFRASNAAGFEGHGIGIPLSASIIRMHDGSMKVESAVREGTTVTVDLPSITP